MELQHQIVVDFLRKNRPIRRPMHAFEDDHMACVHFPNGRHNLLVQRHQPVVILREPIRQRLVQQIIPRHNPFILVPFCEHLPELDSQPFILLIGKQVGMILLRIVDVRPRLAPWRAVQIQDDIQAVILAPADHPVDIGKMTLLDPKGLFLVFHQKTRVDRNPYGVEAFRRNPLDVRLRSIALVIQVPEPGGLLWTDQTLDHRFDPSGSVSFLRKFPHVAFRQQPVAEADALKQYFTAFPVHQPGPLRPDKASYFAPCLAPICSSIFSSPLQFPCV
ncbi:hypothetical protein D3C75_744460 [compost metagenome]